MAITLMGIVLVWFARQTNGFRRILRYLLMGLHLLFLIATMAFFSNEHTVKEPALESVPMSKEDKFE